MTKEKVDCMSVRVKRECGVESTETVCEKIVPLVKLNEEQSLLFKYFNLSMCMGVFRNLI